MAREVGGGWHGATAVKPSRRRGRRKGKRRGGAAPVGRLACWGGSVGWPRRPLGWWKGKRKLELNFKLISRFRKN
jgi:hypothetical protein